MVTRKQITGEILLHRIGVLLFLIWLSSTYSQAQCPRGLNEVTIPPTNNLELYLPLDNNTDNFGTGDYDMILQGATFVDAKCNGGLEFDGINDYLQVLPSLDLIDDFTISAWIRPYNQDDPMSVFSIREQCTSTYRGYSMAQFGVNVYTESLLSHQVNVHQNCSGFSGGDRYINPNIILNENEDVFVAVTVQNNSSENRVVKLYVNCQEFETEMTLDFSTAVSFSSAREYITTIGASSNVSGYYESFEGIVDEVRVYTEVLDRLSLIDIYFQCTPLEIVSTDNQNCEQDSTFITLFNTEPDVSYQLFDMTNNLQASNVVNGDCNSITFGIGPLSEATAFQVQAESLLSDCSITLDTTFYIDPFSELIIEEQMVFLCPGDSILFDESYLFNGGTYDMTIASVEDCDTLVILEVIEIESPITELTVSICTGDSLLFNGTYVSLPGFYSSTLTSIQGCDSIVVWDLINEDVHTSNLSVTICEGDSIQVDDVWYYDEDVYSINLISSGGCDSLLILDLIHSPYYEGVLEYSVCEGDSILFEGNYYSQSGGYLFPYSSIDGCDSIITLLLTVEPEIVTNDYITICDGDSSLIHGEWLFESGVYTSTNDASDGCDSISVVQLLVISAQEYNLELDLCEGDSVFISDEYILSEGIYSHIETTAMGCDSIITIQVNVIPYLRDTVDYQICTGDSILLFDEYINEAGNYSDTISASIGCNSIITINVDVIDMFFTSVEAYICEGDSILFDEWIYEEGMYLHNFTTDRNCDSLVELEVLYYENPPTILLPDLTINDAENVVIDLGVDLDNWSVDWRPSSVVDCDNCAKVNVIATQTSDIFVSLISDDGCLFEYNFNVNVIDFNVTDIPNIFSPNNDGFNDEFIIDSDGSREFSISIYDRWGNLVYLSVDDTKVSWDGTFNDKAAITGVYAYVLSYINRMGIKESIAGNVTLVR